LPSDIVIIVLVVIDNVVVAIDVVIIVIDIVIVVIQLSKYHPVSLPTNRLLKFG
jgi:hypothetical protein